MEVTPKIRDRMESAVRNRILTVDDEIGIDYEVEGGSSDPRFSIRLERCSRYKELVG